MINLNIKLDEGAFMPIRAYKTDAGLDLMIPIDVEIPAHGNCFIDTGVHMEIPSGYFGKLETKSGLNSKHIVSMGGVIDANYTGSIKVILYNLSENSFLFNRGDKIIQIIIQPCEYPYLHIVEKLSDSERGNNGFGSSGK